jgi:molybdate transport system substrate-binding protein
VFLSANVSYIDELITIGRLKPDSKRIFAHGRLVLWAPTIDLPLETLADLQRPEIKSIALANPNHAPYGMAMKDALIAAGVWDSLTDKLIFGEDVSQCYHYAVTGNVDVAIIPFSFIASKASGHWMEIPDSLYPPLEQTAAITTKTPNQALAQRFIELLTSPKAQETLTSHGYILPPNEVAEP